MSSDVFWSALALMLVFEGIFPFLAPGSWRSTFHKLLAMQDGQLRFFGLCSILLGAGLLWVLSSPQ